MEYGLIGEKLVHSYSPQIHAQLANYDYQLCPLSREKVDAFMTERSFQGINVTIPYKQTVMPYCDVLTRDAREIGCVNTIVKQRDGTLLGHNTDIAGFIAMLESAHIYVAGKKAVILGSGGTSHTAHVALRRMGAREIEIISRSGPENYDALYQKHFDAQVLVNTTPVGMYPNNGQSPADLSKLPNLQSVVDVIYNPEKTALILEAEKRKLSTVSGLYMLVSQARKAAEMFTGHPIDAEKDAEITAHIKRQMLNLVFIGMPGCGKTTLGQLAAEKLNRTLIDTDAEIERLAGKTIPEIFAQDGEAHFRQLEAQVIRQFSSMQGLVITTGGGAILKEENRLSLRQNARVCHIFRPLDRLAKESRPLSQGPDAIMLLWQQREALYTDTMDFQVNNISTVQQAVQEVVEGFYEAAGH